MLGVCICSKFLSRRSSFFSPSLLFTSHFPVVSLSLAWVAENNLILTYRLSPKYPFFFVYLLFKIDILWFRQRSSLLERKWKEALSSTYMFCHSIVKWYFQAVSCRYLIPLFFFSHWEDDLMSIAHYLKFLFVCLESLNRSCSFSYRRYQWLSGPGCSNVRWLALSTG